jgi:cytochrome c oxidase subunit 2
MVVTLGVTGLIFLLVAGLIGAIVLRSRGPAPPGEPHQNFGNLRLETAWTLGSLLTVGVLFALTVPVLHQSHPPLEESGTPTVTVIGHQWWWEVRYPTTSPVVFTANEIHLPVGIRSLVALESADVIHDFWVPTLGPKQDMLPGQTNYLWLEPTRSGVYDGACAEFCGNEHAGMRIRVIADSPEDYARWIAAQQAPQGGGTGTARGAALFRHYACSGCHAVTSEGARVAPDLTHLAQRQTLGAGVVVNSPANLALWLKDPQALKPQCNMPSFNLSEAEVADLTAFLEAP